MAMASKIRLSLSLLFLTSRLLAENPLPKDLVSGLASEDFSERERSQAELLDWSNRNPKEAAAALLGLSKAKGDPEIRKRSLEILKSLAMADYLADGKGYLGILMGEEILAAGAAGEPPMGIRVLDVMPGSPAKNADLRQGDLIIALDGKGWKGVGASIEFGNMIAAKKPMVEVKLTVKRDAGNPIEIVVKLGKRPIADLQAAGGEDLRKLEEQAEERHFREWLKDQDIE